MIRSLYTGEAGIKTHQTRMDVIGNNVANVNTTGFKSGRGTFDDILSQTLKGATASNGTLGSTNPTQIGLGVKLSAVDMMFRNGSIQSTGKNTDLALSGDGLFAVKDATRTYYTRNGDFGFDEAGNYVQNGTGLFVQGWMATNGVVTPGGATTNINVQMGKVMPAKVTTEEYYHANLDASTPIGKTVDVSMNEYGADGTLVSRPMHFTKTANNSWTVTSDPSVSSGSWTINFDEHGKFAGGSGLISYTDGKGAQGVTVHMGDLTQYDSATTLYTDSNGYAEGKLTSVNVSQSGIITGNYDNGQHMVEAEVAVARFSNPQGLTRKGRSLFTVSSNSGTPTYGAAKEQNSTITPAALEMSNVDIANEFSDMIVTQRGFQSNSKVITTSDENLETAINLKR